MLFYVRVLAISLLLCGATGRCAERPDLRQRAIQVLDRALTQGEFWEQVHVAEAMLKLHLKREHIINVFSKKLQKCRPGMPMETGVLRVLIQGGDDKDKYLNRLRAIAFDPNAAGRIHAVEALAKLKYHPNAKEITKLNKSISGSNKLLAAYSIWLSARAGEKNTGEKLYRMLSSREAVFYITAANAMYFRDLLSPRITRKLNEIFENEKSPLLFRAFVFRALTRHGKTTTEQAKLFWRVNRKKLSGKNLCIALLAMAGCNSRVIAVPYLKNTNREIRIAAAYVVLIEIVKSPL